MSTNLMMRAAVNKLRFKRTFGSISPKVNIPLEGIFPPIITPFDKNYKVCYKSLEKNFAIWNTQSFAGYVVMGSNGESVMLNQEEKLSLLKATRKLANPSHLIIAGLGCNGTEETIDLINQVASDGSADAALIITPSFYKGQMTDLVLATHFQAIGDKARVPIILYSVPGNTNVELSAEVAISLSAHPNIIGMKDSGGDIAKISRIVAATEEEEFQVLAGSAGFLLPALFMGSTGGVCALANVLGPECVSLYNLFREGRVKEAIEVQRKLILPNHYVTRKLGVPGLKSAMDSFGMNGGIPRPPLLPLPKPMCEEMMDVFAKGNFHAP